MLGASRAQVEETYMECLRAGNDVFCNVPHYETTWPVLGTFRVPYGTHPHLIAHHRGRELRGALEERSPDWADLSRGVFAEMLWDYTRG